MFVNMNMKNLTKDDFQQLCRACMSNIDVQPLQDNYRRTLQNITDLKILKDDELPQQLCSNCIKKINEVHAFALHCKRIDFTLKKYLANFKIDDDCFIVPLDVKQEVVEQPQNIEFVKIEEDLYDEKPEISIDEGPVPVAIIKEINLLKPFKKKNEVSRRLYKCDVCKRRFSYIGSLRLHKRRLHLTQKPDPTDVCECAQIPSAPNKRRKQYKCSYCNRIFTYLGSLTRHKRSHPDFKMVRCNVCKKPFKENKP